MRSACLNASRVKRIRQRVRQSGEPLVRDLHIVFESTTVTSVQLIFVEAALLSRLHAHGLPNMFCLVSLLLFSLDRSPPLQSDNNDVFLFCKIGKL